jgi:serine/threonine protein kinase
MDTNPQSFYLVTDNDKNHRYDFISFLGDGSFGKVHKALDAITKDEVAIKIMDKQKLKSSYTYDAEKLALREINIALSLEHINIVRTCEVFQDDQNFYLVMELIIGESLEKKTLNKPLKEKEAWHIMKQCIEGINYLHQNKIVHRDLKPANIMVSDTGVVKICDFGFSRPFAEEEELKQSFMKTLAQSEMKCSPLFAAPRLLKKLSNTEKKEQMPHEDMDADDLWSLGIIFYQILTGKRVFEVSAWKQLFSEAENVDEAKVRQKVLSEKPDITTKELDLLLELLQLGAKEKITADHLFKKYIINNVQ